MKKILIIISIGFNILCAGYILFSNKAIKRSHVQSMCNVENTKKRNLKTYRIALVKPATHPALDTIEQGFKETIESFDTFYANIETFNANGSEMLLRAEIAEIVHSDFDIIVPIGAHATHIAKETTAKKQKSTPIVFCAVADPIRLGLVKSQHNSGNNVTGSCTSTNYAEQIALLCELKKDIKNVLLVYDPTQSSGLEVDKLEIQNILNKRGISLQTVEIYHTNELKQKLPGLLSTVDILLTLKDNTVLPGRDVIIKLCNQYKVCYAASELDSVQYGASIGYGVREYDFGASGAQQVLSLIEKNIKPHELPVVATNNYQLVINKNAAAQQGLAIDSKLQNMLQISSVIQRGSKQL